MLDGSEAKVLLLERKHQLDVLARVAASQFFGIYLIIAALQISSIFCQKRKSYFGPSSISPMSANQKGDESKVGTI